jgi:hypothetical protein
MKANKMSGALQLALSRIFGNLEKHYAAVAMAEGNCRESALRFLERSYRDKANLRFGSSRMDGGLHGCRIRYSS